MKFSLKLLESDSQIQQMILQALIPSSKKLMNSSIARIKAELPYLVYTAIASRAEYNSLVGGQLRLEFGIPDAGIKVSSIIDAWISNIIYNYNEPVITGKKIKGSFSAELIRVDFADVLKMSEANVVDLVNGYSLPWLKWLLLDGSATIVPRHDVVFGPNQRSRTGGAIMKSSASGWKVPSEYSGTISDNWITRAIDDAATDIEKLLEKAFV
jgi:hypothetical protein